MDGFDVMLRLLCFLMAVRAANPLVFFYLIFGVLALIQYSCPDDHALLVLIWATTERDPVACMLCVFDTHSCTHTVAHVPPVMAAHLK